MIILPSASTELICMMQAVIYGAMVQVQALILSAVLLPTPVNLLDNLTIQFSHNYLAVILATGIRRII